MMMSPSQVAMEEAPSEAMRTLTFTAIVPGSSGLERRFLKKRHCISMEGPPTDTNHWVLQGAAPHRSPPGAELPGARLFRVPLI